MVPSPKTPEWEYVNIHNQFQRLWVPSMAGQGFLTVCVVNNIISVNPKEGTKMTNWMHGR